MQLTLHGGNPASVPAVISDGVVACLKEQGVGMGSIAGAFGVLSESFEYSQSIDDVRQFLCHI